MPKLVMLAHGGTKSDWPALTGLLVACGLSLAPCVDALGCSRHLFVAEKADELGAFWGMKHVFMARFGEKIKNAHTAIGDVRCALRCLSCAAAPLLTRAHCSAMEKLFMDVAERHGHTYVEVVALNRSEATPPEVHEAAAAKVASQVRGVLRTKPAGLGVASAR